MKQTTVLAGLMVGLSCAGDFSFPRYQKAIDLSELRSKHLVQAVLEPANNGLVQMQMETLPVVRSDQPPVLPETLELGLKESQMPLVQKKKISELGALDWTYFGIGFVLGAFITMVTTGLASLTCLQKWAFIIASLYSFYIYMILYEKSNFENQTYLMGMILGMVQFFEAMDMKGCSKKKEKSNGFENFNVSENFLYQSLDLTEVSAHDYIPFADNALWTFVQSIMATFGAGSSSNDGVEPDTSTTGSISENVGAITAQISIVIIITSLAIVADVFVLLDLWDDEDFFNAGVFLGKSTAEAIYVIWLIIQVIKLNQAAKEAKA